MKGLKMEQRNINHPNKNKLKECKSKNGSIN